MKSEHNANPAEDEEVIELTDILKSGPDAEETILDLTDVVETVKAEPHDPSNALDEGQPLELDESAVVETDTTEALVDLTDALDPPELTVPDNVLDQTDDESDEAQAMLDLDDVIDDGPDDDMALDLEDALGTPDNEETILDLDESLVEGGLTDDGSEGDDGDTAADIAEEIEVDPQVLDLAEVLDAAEADEDFLALDVPADDASNFDGSDADVSAFGETLEVIEADPVEDPLANVDPALDDDELAASDQNDAAEDTDADEFDGILDLDQPIEATTAEETTAAVGPAAAQAAEPLFGADDAGEDLDFKLDEMLAEAQAEMPDLDDDEADMELDLSEALADAAADSTGTDPEAILDLNAPVAPVLEALDDGEAVVDERDDFDLISADKIIALDDPVVPDSPIEAASKHDNVIDLADVTGGYPTINPASEFDTDAPGEAEALLDDAFLDEDNTADSLATAEPVAEDESLDDDDLDLGITLDDDESTEEDGDFQLSPEMEKLEATLDDMFQDDEADDLNLGIFADSAAEGADEGESELDAAPVAEAAAMNLPDEEATPVATKAPVGDLPAEITEAVLDAAVSRVIKTMYADRIEQMILDVIKEAVTAEIDKVKRSLGDKA